MRVGIAQWCLQSQGVEAIYDAAGLGLKALHIGVTNPESPHFIGRLEVASVHQKALAETGISVTGLACNLMDDYPINTMQDYLCQVIDAAHYLNVPMVYVPSFGASEIRTSDDLKHTADVLRMGCEYIGNRPLILASENSLGVDASRRLLAMVDHPMMHLMLDTYNPVLWGHRTVELIEGLWSHLCDQIHAKDGTNQIMGSARIGQGDADFADTAASLRVHKFDGTVILENEYDPSSVVEQIRYDIGQVLIHLGDQHD